MHAHLATLLSGALSVLIQSFLILSASLLIARFLRANPGLRHAVLLSGLAIAIGASIFAIWNPADLRGLEFSGGAPATVANFGSPVSAPDPAVPDNSMPALPHAPDSVSADLVPASDLSHPGYGSLKIAAGEQPRSRIQGWHVAGIITCMAWLAGSLYLALKFVVGVFNLRRSVRGSYVLEDIDSVRLWRQSLLQTGICNPENVPILVSSGAVGPSVSGVFRPRLVIPEQFTEQLSEPALRAVFAHEAAHVFRRDPLVGMIERVAQILLWPQVLIHPLLRELDRSREELCDNYALAESDRQSYSRLLFELTSMIRPPAKPLHQGAFGLLRSRWRLEHRISDILNPNRNTMTKLTKKQSLIPCTCIALFAIAISGARLSFGQEGEAPDPDGAEKKPVAAEVPRARAEVKIAEALETWGGAEIILIGKLVEAKAGGVAASLPPIYSHSLSVEVDRVARGQVKGEGGVVTLHHSARQMEEPTFPVGERCAIAAVRGRGGLMARLVVEATDNTLAAIEQVESIPIGWGLEDGRLASPWGRIEGAKWAGPKPDGLVRCAVTGRPALLAGPGVTLTVKPKAPAKEIKWTNPDGDGICIVTVSNPTAKELAVPALLGKGGEIAWDESLALRVHNTTYPVPGAEGAGRGLEVVTLKPGESVSGEINILTVQGPEWPRGGSRITIQFCLGELATSQSFYYMSRHHDKIRKAAVEALGG